MKIARGFVSKEAADIEMQLSETTAVLIQGISIPIQMQMLKPEEVYPDYKEILPKGEPKFQISFDVRELSKLAVAFGCKKLMVSFYAPNKPLRIIPLTQTSEEVGFIMPAKNQDLLDKKE